MTTVIVNGEEKLLEVADVKTNFEGYHYQNRFVRLPEGMIADDLRDSKIWRKIQIGPASNRILKYDHLFLLAFDESFFAEAICNHADDTSASLTMLKVGSFRDADTGLFSDGTYKVVWTSSGYAVYRVSDNVMMGNIAHSTKALAKAALLALYPKKVV